jgi:hypothetical protein
LDGNGTPDYIFAGGTNTIENFTTFSVVSVTNALSLTSTNNIIDGFFTGTFAGDGGGLANLSAGHLTGTVPDARLSVNVPLLNANQSFTGANSFGNPGNNFNGSFNGTVSGSGSGLTGLNASQLTVGTIPLAAIPTPAVVTNGAGGVILSGAFSGNGAGLTNLNLTLPTNTPSAFAPPVVGFFKIVSSNYDLYLVTPLKTNLISLGH